MSPVENENRGWKDALDGCRKHRTITAHLVKLASLRKSGVSEGSYTVKLTTETSPKKVSPRLKFRQYENAFELLII